jgi:hypothetical protein
MGKLLLKSGEYAGFALSDQQQFRLIAPVRAAIPAAKSSLPLMNTSSSSDSFTTFARRRARSRQACSSS